MTIRAGCRWGGALLSAVLLLCGCPRPADDQFEPNDTLDSATLLTAGEPLEARLVQDTSDVFSVLAGGETRIVFDLQTLGGQDCVDFKVTGPGGAVLYEDGRLAHQCGSPRSPKIRAEGVQFIELTNRAGYQIIVSVSTAGEYFLTLRELGYADNVPTYAWDFRLAATLE